MATSRQRPDLASESPLTRRRFLASAAALAAAATFDGVSGVAWAKGRPLFTLGVASGDPAPHGVVLWTRLAPEPLAGGGMAPVPVWVSWRVATDPSMRHVVRSGRTLAWPALAHSVHVHAFPLAPDRWYFYQFEAGGELSPVGRTRTLPRRHHDARRMRVALASCQNWQEGFYAAYADMADQDLDLVLHAGDYIYEGGIDEAAPARRHNGPEAVTLADYRNRYALYRSDPALRAVHASFPFVVTTDDHEVDGNYAGDVPQDAPASEAFLARRAAAYRAYFEHMPLRFSAFPIGPYMRLFRRFRFGRLAEINVLDTRQYRTDQPCDDGLRPSCADLARADQTLLGSEQEAWLLRGLQRSHATYNVLLQQVMMARWNAPAARGATAPRWNMDAWDGYPLARQRILSLLEAQRIANPIVLTGDFHASWTADLRADFDDPSSRIVGTEFVGPAISSAFTARGRTLVESSLPDNPHVHFFDGRYQGYVRIDVDHRRWHADYRAVEDVLDPRSPVFTMASFASENGRPGAVTA